MNDNDSIIIRETLGGQPLEAAPVKEKTVAAIKPLRKADPYILGIYLVFIVISLIEIFSASSTEVKADNIYGPLKRHAIFLMLGVLIVYGMQRLHYGHLRKLAWPLGILSFGLLVFASLFGANINGAQRAIMIGGFTIQPPEIVKYTVVLLLAKILGSNQLPGGVAARGIITVAVVVLLFGAVLWVNGLTNMLLLMGVSLAMFLIGNIQFKKLLIVLTVYGACAGLLVMVKYRDSKPSEYDRAVKEMTVSEEELNRDLGRESTHLSRLKAYAKGVEPTDQINDENRQVWFATMAQAHGGVIGKGPGNSRESARLPLAFSDYIYSIIIEDTGLVGGCLLLLLYLLLVARAGVIAFRLRKAFPTFLIMGCAVIIVFQALVHMAIVVGLGPVSGQPLPFISKGGTSILVMSAAIGSMLSVSRFAQYRKDSLETRGRRRKKAADEEEQQPVFEELDAASIEG
ncbi:MAG: FtsW/RodA/SpoVE family cell cycle protein [Muribaculaceae bacterium]|nr:FtsW/RodA/SpoVE family cell cycle protein [Muribaculaceae bacterium]